MTSIPIDGEEDDSLIEQGAVEQNVRNFSPNPNAAGLPGLRMSKFYSAKVQNLNK